MFDEVDRLQSEQGREPPEESDEPTAMTILKVVHSETEEELHVIDGTDSPVPNKNEVVAFGEFNRAGSEQRGPSYIVEERSFQYFEVNVPEKSGTITAVTLFVRPM